MNPLALIAFLAGINSTPPSAPSTASEPRVAAEKPATTPGKVPASAKRGGWDRN